MSCYAVTNVTYYIEIISFCAELLVLQRLFLRSEVLDASKYNKLNTTKKLVFFITLTLT
jgi:uncharacterized membrane protein